MSLVKPLCVLPDPPVDGCCNPQEPMPAAPVRPNNPPGLTAITYRIGDFTSFRRAMLDDVARPDLLHGLFDDRPLLSNPFANWHEGGDGDYHTMLIELWAYLADVLTFYQERIANEAYLPTATQRSSALRLVELIGYRPSPGAAASVLLAFTAAKDKMPVAFPRFRVGSRATPDRPAAVYETSAALQTRGEHSAISFSSVAPTNQFAALTDLQVVAGKVQANQTALAQAVTRVWGEAGVRYLRGIPFAAYRMARPAPPASTKKVLRSVVLAGANNRLAAGDYVLLVEYEGKATEQKTPLRLTHVDVDRTAHTTTIQWSEDPGQHYENVTLYALRVTAAPFGSNAPAWNTLPATLIGTVNGVEGPYAKTNWDDTKGPSAFLPTLGQPTDFLFLDSLYDDVHATPETPGWVVLVSDTQSDVFQFTDARPVGITGYAISGRVTRLALTQAIPASTFPLRNTTILAGAEELTLQNLLPLPDPLTGQTLLLDGLYPNLQAGQKVIVSGKLYDPNTVSPSQVPSAEEALLDEPPDLDAANNLTTIVLKQPLQGAYVRAETVLMANVVEATQGETVRNEVLGSGNGGPFQVYTLKKSPLTYLPATSAEGLAATESTLQVTVNQVRWEERPTLVESEPNARVFMTCQTDDGKTLVTFGDGVNGARPPTGRDNIRAQYRKGLGASGNVEMGAVQQLIDSAAGLQRVTNPLAAVGGEDPEGLDKIQLNAPASLGTFGRAVSANDYAALARSYPGIGKASAVWVLRNPVTLEALAQPYIRLAVAANSGAPLDEGNSLLRSLRLFLDARRDPNVPLRIVNFVPVYIELAATIDVADQYPREGTLARARAALNPGINPDGTVGYFAFESLGFGQRIHLSAIYAVLHAVEGVRSATVTTLRRLSPPDADTDPATVRDTIFIRPAELAVIENDPLDSSKGLLTLTLGEGGYVDT